MTISRRELITGTAATALAASLPPAAAQQVTNAARVDRAVDLPADV